MYTGVPTIYSSALAVAQRRGAPYNIPENSTINEAIAKTTEAIAAGNKGKWVVADYTYNDTRDIKLACVCIGNRGHRLDSLDTDPYSPSFEPRPHNPNEAGFFRQMPWVVKAAAADLSSAERSRFCLRQPLMIGGALYYAYYGRVLADGATTSVDITKEVVTNGNSVTTSWTPTSADLSPTPDDTTPSGTTEQVYYNANIIDQIQVTAQDVQWLIEAATLLFGSPTKAYISEIATCAGVKREVTAKYNDAGSAQVPFAGAFDYVGTQVMTWSYASWDLNAQPDGFVMAVNTGDSEPLMANSN